MHIWSYLSIYLSIYLSVHIHIYIYILSGHTDHTGASGIWGSMVEECWRYLKNTVTDIKPRVGLVLRFWGAPDWPMGCSPKRQSRIRHTQEWHVCTRHLPVFVQVLQADVDGEWPQFDLVVLEFVFQLPDIEDKTQLGVNEEIDLKPVWLTWFETGFAANEEISLKTV